MDIKGVNQIGMEEPIAPVKRRDWGWSACDGRTCGGSSRAALNDKPQTTN
jgi:hypothetical protein